jgi:predicted metal-dependent enzyme (double-stranded beta helix superfamily)
MKNRDWLVTGDGQYQACKSVKEWDLLRENYRLYRFLTEVEDVLHDVVDECSCLPAIRLLVRRLITNSYWIQTQYPEPCPKTGFSLLMLYDELGFPLTVQTETISPGAVSRIHNHGTWGVVALLKGEQKNTLWRRSLNSELKERIEPVGEIALVPGNIISFTPEAIHSVEAIGYEPTVTFNIYGETDPSQRFEFNPITHSAKKF